MTSLVMDRPVSIQDDDISVRVSRAPKEQNTMPVVLKLIKTIQLPMEDGHVPGSADISSKRLPISRYLILYSQLISRIRAGRKDDVLLTYSNIIHWRDLPPN